MRGYRRTVTNDRIEDTISFFFIFVFLMMLIGMGVLVWAAIRLVLHFT